MKILHTADWHLGQTFFDNDRKWEHEEFLKWLLSKIEELKIDLLLIAGDIFDVSNPSADAQKMYYSFLGKAIKNNPELQIIIIAGNHDSPSRLETTNPILKEMNVSVCGIIAKNENNEIEYDNLIIPLKKGGYCLAIPYLRQGNYSSAENYEEIVEKIYRESFEKIKDCKGPKIAMGHLHIKNALISENDKSETISVGGLDSVSAKIFNSALDYVALGHLHKSQKLAGRENLRYSGSPLPMSFSEKKYNHGVVFVEIDTITKIEKIEYNSPVKLISIPKKAARLQEVLDEISKLPDGEVNNFSPFIEIKILINENEVNANLKYDINTALKGKSIKLAKITIESNVKDYSNNEILSCEEFKEIQPIELAEKVYQSKYGNGLPEEMKKILEKIIDNIREERAL